MLDPTVSNAGEAFDDENEICNDEKDKAEDNNVHEW